MKRLFEKALLMNTTFPVFNEPISEETQESSDEPPLQGPAKKYRFSRRYFRSRSLFLKNFFQRQPMPNQRFRIGAFFCSFQYFQTPRGKTCA